MTVAAFAKKLGMTHVYDTNNRHIPVTILKLPEQAITAIRTKEKDGYDAIQVGAAIKKAGNKPQKSELEKNSITVPATRRAEARLTAPIDATLGETITANSFQEGDTLIITGKSKGKGFSGGIKRHGWSRGPMSHGSKHHRAPGSIGSGYPQRVVPGKKLPGHMGDATVTTKGHKVVAINSNDNTLAITGTVPGAPKTHIFIRKIG
jgi:large subunit ribosomal protein L3